VNQQGVANRSHFIRQALKSHRQIIQLFGPDWEAELRRLEEAVT
jgi:hypothetical protein